MSVLSILERSDAARGAKNGKGRVCEGFLRLRWNRVDTHALVLIWKTTHSNRVMESREPNRWDKD